MEKSRTSIVKKNWSHGYSWKGKTTVISVAHRLDIIRNYDKIGVM